ncbi:hypothetical protein WG622_17355 [Cognatishimia sp. D5M38]|uniref:Uncharacterized protein n=1 Tax=Cognatishimia coralii TaxID=3083254 RepID=A0ABU8QKR5_9RHOB
MSSESIIKFGDHEAIAGLSWEFGKNRPESIRRTDPYLILDEISTGSRFTHAENLPPLALVVAEICKSASETFDTGTILWAVEVEGIVAVSGDAIPEKFYVSGMLDRGVPTTDREFLYESEADLVNGVSAVLRDADCGEVALSESIAQLLVGDFKLLELDPRSIDFSDVPVLETRAPLISPKMRLLAGFAVLALGFYWIASQWYLPKAEENVAVEQVGLRVDHRAFLEGCANARSAGFPVPLGWQEQSSGCAYVGTTDHIANSVPITTGGLAYRQYRLVPGHDLTIAGIVANYLFEDWPGSFVLENGSVFVTRSFDVELAPYEEVAADSEGEFTNRVKEAFLGTAEKFQEGSVASGARVKFITNLTIDEAIERLSNLPSLELRLLRKQGSNVEIEVTPSARILRPKIQGVAHAYLL